MKPALGIGEVYDVRSPFSFGHSEVASEKGL